MWTVGACLNNTEILDARPLSSVNRPSSTIMMCEGRGGGQLPLADGSYLSVMLKASKRQYNFYEWGGPSPWFYPDTFTGTRHRNRGMYLFADGHVKLLSVRQTLTPQVLWDNYADWCPQCTCSVGGVWTQKDVDRVLKELDRLRYP